MAHPFPLQDNLAFDWCAVFIERSGYFTGYFLYTNIFTAGALGVSKLMDVCTYLFGLAARGGWEIPTFDTRPMVLCVLCDCKGGITLAHPHALYVGQQCLL